MIVVDASALVELVLNTGLGGIVAARIQSPDTALHVPHVVDLEVAQVLRRFALNGVVDDRRAAVALRFFRDLDLDRHPHEPLLERVWALRANLTAYDAAYVALAEVLGAVLLTCDRKLIAASPAVRVELVTLS